MYAAFFPAGVRHFPYSFVCNRRVRSRDKMRRTQRLEYGNAHDWLVACCRGQVIITEKNCGGDLAATINPPASNKIVSPDRGENLSRDRRLRALCLPHSNTMGGFSTTQERILAITPKCGASLSMPCSVFLIYEVWCDHRTRGSTPIQRALVGMSLVDILR